MFNQPGKIDTQETIGTEKVQVNDENTSKKTVPIDLKRAEILADDTAKNIYRTYEIISCLQVIIKFVNENSAIAHKYTILFNHLYRTHFDNLYIQICRLLDEDDKVLSIHYLFRITGTKHLWKKYKNTQLITKIKLWRNKVIAHYDKAYALLNQEKQHEFYQENKAHLDEIIPFFDGLPHLLNEILETIGSRISVFGLQDNPTQDQLSDLFACLVKVSEKLEG